MGYHPDTGEDRFYGGGTGGYYIYDVTDLENPELRITLTGVQGVTYGHTFTPSPDGRYVIAETEYQYAPLRIFDLQPALDGETQNIRNPISAFTADWRHLVHNHEVRWPYVFVSGYLDGLQVFNLQDPDEPGDRRLTTTPTSGRRTRTGTRSSTAPSASTCATPTASSSSATCPPDFWTFRMDGFQGWNGEDWGYPNISSAQKWDAPATRPISE